MNNLRLISYYSKPKQFDDLLRHTLAGKLYTALRFIDLIHVALEDTKRDSYTSDIFVEVYTFIGEVRDHAMQPCAIAIAPGQVDREGIHSNGVWDFEYLLETFKHLQQVTVEEMRTHGWNKCFTSILRAMHPLLNSDKTGFDLSVIPIIQTENV